MAFSLIFSVVEMFTTELLTSWTSFENDMGGPGASALFAYGPQRRDMDQNMIAKQAILTMVGEFPLRLVILAPF